MGACSEVALRMSLWVMCGRLRVGKDFLHVLQHWSVQPCVRPFNAVHMTAGHAFLSTIRHVELCFCCSRALALTMGAKAERKRRFIAAAPVGHRPQPLTFGRCSRV